MDPDVRTRCVEELEANLWECWPNLGRGKGSTLHEHPDAIWYENPIPVVPYNMVLKFCVQEDVDRRIDEIVSAYRSRDVPFTWILHPTASPSDLGRRLIDRGLVDAEQIQGMARLLDDVPDPGQVPDGFVVREVADTADAAEVADFISYRWRVPDSYRQQLHDTIAPFGFGTPDAKARMWQAWRDGKAVAKVGMFIAERSVGIYGVATRPEARRMGLARLLTLVALNAAREAGYEIAVLHASPMAVRLYEQLGFEFLADFRIFASEEIHV